MPIGNRGTSTFQGNRLIVNASGQAGGGGLPFDPSMFLDEALAGRRAQREAQLLQNRGMRGDIRENERLRRERRNPQAEGGAVGGTEVPWYTQQAVARTPVTGMNMTGDYTIDPNKLPPSMRAQSSSFGPSIPESRAGLSSEGGGEGGGGEGGGSKGGREGSKGSGPEERADWNKTGTTNLAAQQVAGQKVGERMGAELAASNTAQALGLPPSMIPWLMTPEGQRAAARALSEGLELNARGGTEGTYGGPNIGQPRPITPGPWSAY